VQLPGLARTAEYRAASGHTNAASLKAAQAQRLALAAKQVDLALFTQWVDAYSLKRTALADFYFRRFRREFRPAVLAWLKTRPLTNPSAPLTPFAMPIIVETSKCVRRRRAAGPVTVETQRAVAPNRALAEGAP
jgi:hypothetical protein